MHQGQTFHVQPLTREIWEMHYLPAFVPPAHRPSIERFEELLEQIDVIPYYGIRCELQDGDVVSGVVQTGSKVQLVRVVKLPAIECVDGLRTVSAIDRKLRCT